MSFEKVLEVYKSDTKSEEKVLPLLSEISLSEDQGLQLFDRATLHSHFDVLKHLRQTHSLQWWDWVILSVRNNPDLWVAPKSKFPSELSDIVFSDLDGFESLNLRQVTPLENLMVLCGASNGLRAELFKKFIRPKLEEFKEKDKHEWLMRPHPLQPHLRNVDMFAFWVACTTVNDKEDLLGDLLLLGANPNATLQLEDGLLSLPSTLLLSSTTAWNFPFPENWPAGPENRPKNSQEGKDWKKSLETALYFLKQKRNEPLSYACPKPFENIGLYFLGEWDENSISNQGVNLSDIVAYSDCFLERPELLAKALLDFKGNECPFDVSRKDIGWGKLEDVIPHLKEHQQHLKLARFVQLDRPLWKPLLLKLSEIDEKDFQKTVKNIEALNKEFKANSSYSMSILEKHVIIPLCLELTVQQLLFFALHFKHKQCEEDLSLSAELSWARKQLFVEKDHNLLKNAGFLIKKAAQLIEDQPETIVVPEDLRPRWNLFKKEQAEKVLGWMKGKVKENEEVEKWSKMLSDFVIKDQKSYQKPLALGQAAYDALPQLRLHFPHFGHVIDALEDHLSLSMVGDSAFSLPPLLLVGPPGTGKTFFFQQLSLAVQTGYSVLNVESIAGGFALVGLETAYSTAAPGILFETLLQEQGLATANPILLLDEIDKGVKSNHPLEPVLLTLLESHSAQRFTDRCIPLPLDARKVCWVATANDISQVSLPIQSRFTIVEVENPDLSARRSMAQYIYSSLLKDNSWGASFESELSSDVLDKISRPNGAVRQMKKQLLAGAASAAKHGRRSILPDDIKIKNAPIYLPWDKPLSNLEMHA